MVVDDVKLPQSVSIARFAARKFGLAGKDELEQAKADAVVDTIGDFQNAYYQKVFMIKDEEAKKEAIAKFKAEDVPTHLGRIEKLIGLYGSNGFAVGGALTWADLLLYEVTNHAIAMDAAILDSFAGILASRKSVESDEKVGAYLKSRPETPF